jgi:hypothetical protein
MPGYWRAVKGFHGRSLKFNLQKIVISRGNVKERRI